MGNSNCCSANHSKTAQLRQQQQKRDISKIKSMNKKSLINITEEQPQSEQLGENEENEKNEKNEGITDLIEDEKNIKMDRVHRLSLIGIESMDNKTEIRRIINEQYNEMKSMDCMDCNDSDSTESNISELSAADIEERTSAQRSSLPNNHFLQMNESNSHKSNITPKTIKLWNNNELLNIQNEMNLQLQHLKHSNTYKNNNQLNEGKQQQQSLETMETMETMERRRSSLFRFKSYDKWDEDQVKNEQFAMQEEMVHLIQANTQSKFIINHTRNINQY